MCVWGGGLPVLFCQIVAKDALVSHCADCYSFAHPHQQLLVPCRAVLCCAPDTPPLSPQDARKGVLFDDFPPVLQLQLKRFEYDFQRDTMVKVGVTFVGVGVFGGGGCGVLGVERGVRLRRALLRVCGCAGGGGRGYDFQRHLLRARCVD